MNFKRILACILACISFTSCLYTQRPWTCPPECVCSLDQKGREQNICNRGGWNGIPISAFNPDVEVLIIRGPGNHITIGPIFSPFRKLEELRITDSNVPSVGMKTFWGVTKLRILGKVDSPNNNNENLRIFIIVHWFQFLGNIFRFIAEQHHNAADRKFPWPRETHRIEFIAQQNPWHGQRDVSLFDCKYIPWSPTPPPVHRRPSVFLRKKIKPIFSTGFATPQFGR